MTFNSIDEIYEALDAAHARFAETVNGLDEAVAEFRTAPDRWSIAEVAEHVAMVESQVVRLASMMVERAPAAADGQAFAPVSIAEIAERALKEKFQAPETAIPRGGASVSDSLARLERAHAALRELRPRIERTDGTAMSYPHPVFGTLNLYQWLVMVGLHKDRHAQQIAQLKASHADARHTAQS
ncbi:MAG TPA: DinB family protein [Pyrinomonadaceae bacterium]|nr:DinB family protein [Pyrinomonadaceae bacterium]